MSWLSGLEHVVREAEPLAPYTWFRLGGPAQFFAEPTNRDELTTIVRRAREQGHAVRLLGGGSNVLVPDAELRGVVVHLSAPDFCGIAVNKESITAGGGAKLGHVIATAVREGLAGLENLVGIPGTVGGALHGNAGSHAGDIGQSTRAATVLTSGGETLARGAADLHFAYRHSSLDELAILEARFELERDDPVELTKRMQKLWIVKKAAEPMGQQNASPIFKSPPGISAESLIEQAGLKGATIGEAQISERHCNFIVANPRSTSKDVAGLIELVREKVAERLGVELETQIDIWSP
jgi:UDP-N-acetylmuramate dehydrogenase